MMGRVGGGPATNTGAAAANGTQPGPSLVTNAQQVLTAKNNSTMGFVIALVGLAALYFTWAFLSKREGVQKAVNPANLEVNWYNLAMIWLAVVITVPLSKVLLVKMVGWNIPGAKWLLGVVGNA